MQNKTTVAEWFTVWGRGDLAWVAGSSPARTIQYGVWTGSWRGASSPSGHYRGAHEQGTEPLTAWGAILRGSPLALTSLHTLMHVCRSCLCMCVFRTRVYITTERKN